MSCTRFAMYRDATRSEKNQGLDLNGYVYLIFVHGDPIKMFRWNNAARQWEITKAEGGTRFNWEYLPREIRDIAERDLPQGNSVLSRSPNDEKYDGA